MNGRKESQIMSKIKNAFASRNKNPVHCESKLPVHRDTEKRQTNEKSFNCDARTTTNIERKTHRVNAGRNKADRDRNCEVNKKNRHHNSRVYCYYEAIIHYMRLMIFPFCNGSSDVFFHYSTQTKSRRVIFGCIQFIYIQWMRQTLL